MTDKQKTTRARTVPFDLASCMAMMEKWMTQQGCSCDCGEMMSQMVGQSESDGAGDMMSRMMAMCGGLSSEGEGATSAEAASEA